LVRHLHAFVREAPPTEKDWERDIDFLTRTGHMCDDKRQERRDGRRMATVLATPYYHLNYDFGLKPVAGKQVR
jgi:hypothetical protein